MSSPQGIIFDCDGTLAHDACAFRGRASILDRYELAMSEDRFDGGRLADLARGGVVDRRIGRSIDAQQIADEKESLFEEMLHLIKPIEPVVEVVRRHQGRPPLAVATGAVRPICQQILRQIGVHDCFDTIVSSEDVERHKPTPDVFLEAARRLGVAPSRCRVYEDTNPGIEAGRPPGMEYIDVRAFHTPRRVT